MEKLRVGTKVKVYGYASLGLGHCLYYDGAVGEIMASPAADRTYNVQIGTSRGRVHECQLEVLPQPREFWINVYASGSRYVNDSLADATASTLCPAERIHVREVIDETE